MRGNRIATLALAALLSITGVACADDTTADTVDGEMQEPMDDESMEEPMDDESMEEPMDDESMEEPMDDESMEEPMDDDRP